MYYDIVNSGERIKELRAARRMTRQQLAEQIGLSVDALRKIEAGVNGAKIDTLISIAELFHITLDYLVCGCIGIGKFSGSPYNCFFILLKS